ncbi:MAG: type II toxin-antitoxin system RelE/ParE family toxin [Rickettsiales bacterium]|nr:type II toxin-antitoxin system RelE/ParE family toxin [Rickettsiales bacterium]
MIIKQTEVFEKWFKKLRDETAKAAIARRIRILEVDNHFGDAHPTSESGISEMRVFVGKGYRIYYTQRALEIVILLCGGIKSRGAGKEQTKDIRRAKELLKTIE